MSPDLLLRPGLIHEFEYGPLPCPPYRSSVSNIKPDILFEAISIIKVIIKLSVTV